jgi:predicted MFS family arabinose efflux permease
MFQPSFGSDNKSVVINEKKLISILFMVQFTHILDFVIMMPLGPKFMRIFDIGPREFSHVVSAYGIAAACAGIIGSLFMDRYDRKKALVFLYTGFMVGTFACGMAINHHTLILARIVAGSFGGILSGFILSILADAVPVKRRGAATGVVMSAFGVSSVIGIPTGLFLAEYFDWHTPFLFLGGLAFFILLFIIKEMAPMTGHLNSIPRPGDGASGKSNKTGLQDLIEVMVEPNHWRAFVLTIFVILSGFLVIPFISPYMVKNVGLKENELPYLYFLGGLFTLVSSRWIGKMSDKVGKHKMFYVMAWLSLIPLLLITNLPRLPLSMVLIASCLFFIIVSGRFVPAMAIITSSPQPKHRGAFMSLNSTIQSLTMGAASFVSGHIITTNDLGELVNYNWIGFISCGMTLLAIYFASKVQIKG